MVLRHGLLVRAASEIDEMVWSVFTGEFGVSGTASWEEFVECIELLCAINKLTMDADKRTALISRYRPETQQAMMLVKPLRPPNVDCKVSIDSMGKHVQPRPSVLYLRYGFAKHD